MKTTHQRRLAAASLCALLAFPTLAPAIAITSQGTWQTTLTARDLDGDLSTTEAYYDSVLDITWLADANVLGGPVTWTDAAAWAHALLIGGVSGWRLPTVAPVDGSTADDDTTAYNGAEDRGHNVSAPGGASAGSTASELAHLFYNTLGNRSYCDPVASTVTTCSGPQTDYGLSNTALFTHLQADIYWSDTDAAVFANAAWSLNFDRGGQNYYRKTATYYAWVVHEGDVGTAVVPIPAGAGLLISGLLWLIGVARRPSHTQPQQNTAVC